MVSASQPLNERLILCDILARRDSLVDESPRFRRDPRFIPRFPCQRLWDGPLQGCEYAVLPRQGGWWEDGETLSPPEVPVMLTQGCAVESTHNHIRV